MQYIYKYQSPIGGITIASDGSSLTGLWFDGQKYFAASLSPEHEEKVLPVDALGKYSFSSLRMGNIKKNPLRQNHYVQGYC